METKSPLPSCPNTVTVRRNPPRRARPTPSSAVPLSLPTSAKKTSTIRSFPIQDILSIDLPQSQNPKQDISLPDESSAVSENLKVFLRIRPIATPQRAGASVKGQRNVWPKVPGKTKDASRTAKAVGMEKNKKREICLQVKDSHSVTLCPPQSLQDVRRTKTEVYEGFSHVFSAESSQCEVYERMVNPLVEDFLKGKSGMLAALGPSGSGKTHTVFGSAREPGMVPLALRRIFPSPEGDVPKCSRTFYLSMFEIYSERGKGEKLMDLSEDGGDLYMQQSTIKGLQEVVIHDVQQAESLIANGMLKRSTAMTNSNIQSSRSQCIINIRSGDTFDEEADPQSCAAILTIVDLAGAEREKKTGNQGARLLESNFINNTSMVFGLCLRSLLEHQRNPKKPFHKHFQNSMLTKYLRDFLEGKKRMTLILTAKSGEEDYQDTSYLLRQASPYMNIKFDNVEEQPANAFGNKRRCQTLLRAEQLKRTKFSNAEVHMDGDGKHNALHQLHQEVLTPEQVKEVETNTSSVSPPAIIDSEVNERSSLRAHASEVAKRDRENQILLNFSRAFWKVLKEYKNKLEASENEVDSLRHSLIVETERCFALETALKNMKASCSCGKKAVAVVGILEESKSKTKSTNSVLEPEICQSVNDQERHSAVYPNHCEAESVDNSLVSDTNVDQKYDASCANALYEKEDLKELEDTNASEEVAELAVHSTESSVVNGDEISLSIDGDRSQQEEELHAQVTSSNLGESGSLDKRLVSDLNETSSIEVISTSVGLEEHSNENAEVSCANVVSNGVDFKDLEEIEAIGKIGGCDTFRGSESNFVPGDEVSSSLVDDQSQHEEKEKADVSCANDVFDKQDFKEPEEKDAGRELAGCDTSESHIALGIDVSSSVDGDPLKKEAREDIADQQACDTRKAPEVEVSPVKNMKPKRRLQPASSILLRNLNSLDMDDSTDVPKGKRGEKKAGGDVCKRTQGSLSLLRILKGNIHP